MAQIKLLLKESIKNVGKVGDIVEVSPGYARNFLLPKDLAVEPTPNNVKKIEARRQEIEKQERERRAQQETLLKRLEGVEVTLERRANEQGHLYGSVTATEIAKAPSGAGLQRPPGRCEPPGQARPDRHLPGQHPLRRRPGDRNQGVGRPRRRQQGGDRRLCQGSGGGHRPGRRGRLHRSLIRLNFGRLPPGGAACARRLCIAR